MVQSNFKNKKNKKIKKKSMELEFKELEFHTYSDVQ